MMIAELIKQYDVLKECNVPVPDPYFNSLEVWVEIVLSHDGSFRRVNWLGKPKDSQNGKKKSKDDPCIDLDCPVTEKSACRSSGNDSPHGIVDNCSWLFGQLAPNKKKETNKKQLKIDIRKDESPGKLRHKSYLRQLNDMYAVNSSHEIKLIQQLLSDEEKLKAVWKHIEDLLKSKLLDGKKNKLFDTDRNKWEQNASKINMRWVVEQIGSSGKPVNALSHIKTAWRMLQEKKGDWWITSLINGERKPARILHPKIKGASLVSFNNAATYCAHLSATYRGKPGKKEDEEDGSALPAQIGFEEAEKYSKALQWLIDNSSVHFEETVNCIWINQTSSNNQILDKSGYELVEPHGQKSNFKRGKAKTSKGKILAYTGDLIKTLQNFRNGQKADYREKHFYLLSLLLRRKGRHAIIGSYTGTMGLLDDNTDLFINRTKVMIPNKYLDRKDNAREFCPTLMDILSAAGIRSEKKTRLVWDREVIEVIMTGQPLPADLCKLIIQKAIKDKHLEQSRKKRVEYLKLLAIAAGCARHYLTTIIGKENYYMGIDIKLTDSGYLTGRLFAVCENIQKRGRNWGPTLSDKLFSAAIDMPRQTLVQLYRNCLCYDIYKTDSEWLKEIFDKIKLNGSDSEKGDVLPESGVDQFAFMLGYWHQRGELRPKVEESNNNIELQNNK